jgi:hypothetical protein
MERIKQHQGQSPWFYKVSFITIERFPSCEVAATKEKEAIKNEKPLYNKTFNTKSLSPEEWLDILFYETPREERIRRLRTWWRNRPKDEEKCYIVVGSNKILYIDEFIATYNDQYPNPDGSLRGVFAMFD